MRGLGAGAAAHGDPDGDADFALLDGGLHAVEDLLCGGGLAGNDAAVLGEAAEVARGEAHPASRGEFGGTGVRIETFEGEVVELGQPDGGGGFGAPGDDGAIGCRAGDVFHAARTGLEFRRKTRETGKSVGDEVGLDPALFHFTHDGLRFSGNADGYGFTLAKLVFEDAQGLVERGHDEVGYAVAKGAALRGGIGSYGERGGAEDIGRYEKGAAFVVELACIKELAGKARLAVRTGFSVGKQRRVEAIGTNGKHERCVVGVHLHGIER